MCFTMRGTVWGDLSTVNFRYKANEFHFRTSTIIIKLTITPSMLLTRITSIAWWESTSLVVSANWDSTEKAPWLFARELFNCLFNFELISSRFFRFIKGCRIIWGLLLVKFFDLAITTEASELPTTLTDVRPISTKRSIPAMNVNPCIGTPIVDIVANRTTKKLLAPLPCLLKWSLRQLVG